MTTTIAITTFKGGVGKTTTARDLSAALARLRAKVLAVDLDRTQRHLMQFEDGVPSVSFRASTAGRLPRLIERAKRDEYDFVILDCPPALEKDAAAALRAADLVVAPVQPEYLAADGLARVKSAVDAARQINRGLQLRVLITMFDTRDPSCTVVENVIRKQFNGHTVPDTIRRQPAFNAAALKGCSVFEDFPRCQGARVYRGLAKTLIEEAARG